MMRFTLLPLATLTLCVACVPQGGDADGDPGTTLDASVSGAGGGGGGPRVGGQVDYEGAGVRETDQVDALDEAQRAAACDALEATYADALSEDDATAFGCAIQAIFAGFFDEQNGVATCRMAYDACLADPEAVMVEDGDEECPLLTQPECTATLGEIEQCIADGLQAIVDFNATFDCSLVDEVRDMPPMDEGSPACALVEQKCPGLLDDDEAEADATDRF